MLKLIQNIMYNGQNIEKKLHGWKIYKNERNQTSINLAKFVKSEIAVQIACDL